MTPDILNFEKYVGTTNFNGDDSVVIRRIYDSIGTRVGKSGSDHEDVEKVIIYYPGTGLQFVIERAEFTQYGCFLSLKICMPNSYREGETLIGLLGTPDGNPENDWVQPNGHVLQYTSNKMKAYEYITRNWCNEDERKSIFTYTNNDNFLTHRRCGKGYGKFCYDETCSLLFFRVHFPIEPFSLSKLLLQIQPLTTAERTHLRELWVFAVMRMIVVSLNTVVVAQKRHGWPWILRSE